LLGKTPAEQVDVLIVGVESMALKTLRFCGDDFVKESINEVQQAITFLALDIMTVATPCFIFFLAQVRSMRAVSRFFL
jgi:hypothetical protein